NGTHVSEQDAVKARANRTHSLMRELRLLDLNHAAEVLQLERAAEIVQVVHRERRVLGGELDVVVVAGVADQFHQRRPSGQQMRADRRLVRIEQSTQAGVPHGDVFSTETK